MSLKLLRRQEVASTVSALISSPAFVPHSAGTALRKSDGLPRSVTFTRQSSRRPVDERAHLWGFTEDDNHNYVKRVNTKGLGEITHWENKDVLILKAEMKNADWEGKPLYSKVPLPTYRSGNAEVKKDGDEAIVITVPKEKLVDEHEYKPVE